MKDYSAWHQSPIGKALIGDLQKLIQIESVEAKGTEAYPFGKGISDALHYMLDLGERFGFKTENIDEYAGTIEYGEGEEMLGILCHLDVVPSGKDWHYPPFGGVLTEDAIVGRGTQDDKGPAMSVLYAMKTLKEQGYIPNKRIRLILGTNEESGNACMAYYCEHAEIPTIAFSPDADFPVIHGEMGILLFELTKVFTDRLEDGGVKVITLSGGNAPNMVPDSAQAELIETKPIIDILKAYNETTGSKLSYERQDGLLVVNAKGISAHSSMPERGRNAISDLLGFLDQVDLEIGDEANFIRFLNRTVGNAINGEQFNIGFEDAYNKLVLNLGMIAVTDEIGKATLHVRYPITYNEATIREGIEKTLEGTGIDISKWRHVDPLFFEKDHPLVTTLMNVYRDVTGDYDSEPLTIGGGTYARSMPNAVAFGALFAGSDDLMHQKDERLTYTDLAKMTEIYEKAIIALTSN